MPLLRILPVGVEWCPRWREAEPGAQAWGLILAWRWGMKQETSGWSGVTHQGTGPGGENTARASGYLGSFYFRTLCRAAGDRVGWG